MLTIPLDLGCNPLLNVLMPDNHTWTSLQLVDPPTNYTHWPTLSDSQEVKDLH